MAIELEAKEQILRDEITERMGKAFDAFKKARTVENPQQWINDAGERAHKLHLLLKQRGHEPRHHAYMIKNRRLSADHPDFYKHYHPLEDLLKFLADEHANDDPEDQTIGGRFTFSVYSKRWAHEDTYRIQRTADGWVVEHMAIGGPCDKSGEPFLFANFQQDSIEYPAGLGDWMDWLWRQAAEEGLTHKQLQDGLQQLADWVSNTEKSRPSEGVWERY